MENGLGRGRSIRSVLNTKIENNKNPGWLSHLGIDSRAMLAGSVQGEGSELVFHFV
jgi:hypothetical protein